MPIYYDEDLEKYKGSAGKIYNTAAEDVISRLSAVMNSLRPEVEVKTPLSIQPSDRETYLQRKFDELISSIRPGMKRAGAQAYLTAASEVGKELAGLRELGAKRQELGTRAGIEESRLGLETARTGTEAAKSILEYLMEQKRAGAAEAYQAGQLRYLMDKLGLESRELLGKEAETGKRLALGKEELELKKKEPLYQILSTMITERGKTRRGFSEILASLIAGAKGDIPSKIEALKTLEAEREGANIEELLRRLGLDVTNPLGLR